MRWTKRKETNFIVLHSSMTPPSEKITAETVRRAFREARQIDTGYHYVIERDGTVVDGRPHDAVGNHCDGFDDESIGVLVLGGADEEGDAVDNFTPEQVVSLTALLRSLIKVYPRADITSHGQMPENYCECFKLDIDQLVATGRIYNE
jgi:N-acetylmuramoyl-L-alanine amidase